MIRLWLWVRRRNDLAPGDIGIGDARDHTPTLVVLAGVLALETAVVGLLVPWPFVHVLDVLAVLQVLEIAATGVTRPHYVRDDVLFLRTGRKFEVRVPLALVATVRAERKYHSGQTVQWADDELAIVIGNQTDVLVILSEPVTTPKGPARVVRFRADDPVKAVRVIRGTVSGSRR
jgi:hypothetical protein